MDLTQFKDQQFLSLETFRKSGVGVKAPIWFAEENNILYMWTVGEWAKIKRIRNNPQVKIAPCTSFDEVTGEWGEARASVDDSVAAVQHVEKILRKKIGFGFAIFQFIDGLRDRRREEHRVCLMVSIN